MFTKLITRCTVDINPYKPAEHCIGTLGLMAIGAGMSMATGAVNNVAAAADSAAARNWQRQEREMSQIWQEQQAANQYLRTVQMWNMENEYNAPVNQMDRMMAAGINPNNAAGLTAAGNNNGFSPAPGVSGVSDPSASLVYAPFESGVNPVSLEQSGLLEAQKKKTDADTDLVKSQTEGQTMSNSVFLTQKNVEWALASAESELKKSQKEGQELSNANQKFINDTLNPILQNKNQEEVNNLLKAGKVLDEQLNTQKAQTKLVGAQTRAQQESTVLMGSQKEYYDKQAEALAGDVAVSKIKEKVAKEQGVDLGDLDGYEKVNAQLREAGYTTDQIDQYWSNLQNSVGVQVEREFKQKPLGTVGDVITGGAEIGTKFGKNAKRVRKKLRQNRDGSTVNP